MRSKEEIIKSGLLEKYILGVTTEEEDREIEECLDKYPELEEHLEGMIGMIDNISDQHGIPHKKKILNNKKTHSLLPLFVMLLVVGLATLSIYFGIQKNRIEQQLSQVISEKEKLLEKHNELKNTYQKIDKHFDSIKKSEHKHIPINMDKNGKERTVAVVCCNEALDKSYFNALSLSPPPENETYYLWGIKGGETKNLGSLDFSDKDMLSIPSIEDYEQLQISLQSRVVEKEQISFNHSSVVGRGIRNLFKKNK